MTIFLVQSNFKHDGQPYAKGSFFEGDAGTFSSLVADGVLLKIEGASTFEEAEEILANQKETAEEGAQEAIVEPQDTWGPSPEQPEAPAVTPEEITTEPTTEEVGDVYDGPMGQYKITGEAYYTDEEGVRQGTLEIGSIQVLPTPVGEVFVKDGVAEEIKNVETKNITEDNL